MTTAGQGRMAAVLFTDLVGSTELLSRLGEAAFDGLRRAHFAALREAIGRSGGAEIKTTGDGLLATFSSAADAVGCAVSMQQTVDVHGRAAEVTLAIRVGVSVGDVVFEDGDVFGTPLVEAARLVALAHAGQILATSLVRGIAGGRSVAAFTDIGCLELKGLPTPVATCEVAWEPLPAPAAPLPALLTGMGRIFVGRDVELARLQQLWEDARTGALRVALIGGEPGVGKTRLAAELSRRAHEEGATVLAGRCDEDLGVPYQPFVEALRHLIDHTPSEELVARLGRYGGELARLVPELSEPARALSPPLRSDPETERYRLFDAVASWLGAISQSQPVLLVLDDLQWAAKPTLLLLWHVLRSREPMRLLVLATYRDTEVGRTHPLGELLADLRQLDSVERISISGLDEPAVAAFLEQAAGHELRADRDELARAVHRETEGNAFFVREVVRHLIETGGVRQEGGRWTTAVPVGQLGIPEAVRDVLGRRLSRLSEKANQALAVAAVAGQDFDLAVVGRAGGLEEEALLAALDEAVSSRLVAEASGLPSRYRFAHALVRATLYEELSGPRRVVLHRRVAEAIESLHRERLDDHLPALAYHFARAFAPQADATRAVDYARRAGDRALAQLAHDEAANYYGQALALLDAADASPDQALRTDLLIALGEAQRRAGDPAHRETLLTAARLARNRGDADALSRAALANSRSGHVSTALATDAERIDVLEAALRMGDEADPVMRARLLSLLAVELVFAADRDRRLALSDEALRLARQQDDATLAHVLISRVPAIWDPTTLNQRLENTAELLTIADRLGDPVTMFRAHWLRSRTAIEAGDLGEADRHFSRAKAISADLGQPTLRWMEGWSRASRLLLAGKIDEAERLFHDMFQLAEATGQPDAKAYFIRQLFQVRLEQGRVAEIEGLVADARHRYPGLQSVAAMQAQLCCELDRNDEARTLFEELARFSFTDLSVNALWLWTVMMYAAVAAHLGDVGRAVALHALLAPFAEQRTVAGGLCLGPGHHYLGILATTTGHFDVAEAHFAAASADDARMGAPVGLGRTRLEWARMLLDRRGVGDVERARELLGQALTTARALGLGNVERRSVALLEQVS